MKKSFDIDNKHRKANKRQLELMKLCIEKCKQSQLETGGHFEVTLTNKEVYFNGVLVFMMKVTAITKGTMLSMCNKTYFVKIGRRGKVTSFDISKENDFKENKYCIFV